MSGDRKVRIRLDDCTDWGVEGTDAERAAYEQAVANAIAVAYPRAAVSAAAAYAAAAPASAAYAASAPAAEGGYAYALADLARIEAGEHPVHVLDGDEKHYDGGYTAHTHPTAASDGGILTGCWTTIVLDSAGDVVRRLESRVQS